MEWMDTSPGLGLTLGGGDKAGRTVACMIIKSPELLNMPR